MKRKIALLLAWIAVAAPVLAAEEPESRRKESRPTRAPFFRFCCCRSTC